MKFNLFEKNRFDCFVIWGHGLSYLDEIIDDIRSHDAFKIVQIQRHKVKNIKKLVHKIYSFDYAPLFHLKAKVKYLESTPPTVYFIFIKNQRPKEEFFGEGDFRHKECLKIKAFKNLIRGKFNPRTAAGNLTHDHAIHATDNESQTDSILKLLGFSDGVQYLKNNKKIIESPHYIDEPEQFTIKRLSYQDIYCSNAFEEEGKMVVKQVSIVQSVQYSAFESPQLYKDYIKKFKGTILKQDYDFNKYLSLKENFEYLSSDYSTDFVLVKKIKNKEKYLVIDGLHRATIHRYQGNQHLIACVI
jgi:hypothetical protein